MKVSAERRKRNFDRHVHDAPLKVGQLVKVRDFSIKGRRKIQDLWGSAVYKVLRAPDEGGSVYTITPADDLTQVRQVNRTLLKAVVEALPTGEN